MNARALSNDFPLGENRAELKLFLFSFIILV